MGLQPAQQFQCLHSPTDSIGTQEKMVYLEKIGVAVWSCVCVKKEHCTVVAMQVLGNKAGVGRKCVYGYQSSSSNLKCCFL